MRKPVFRVFDQVRHKQVLQAIAASQRLEILDSETRKISLSTQRKAKVLISLRSNAADQHLCFRIHKKTLPYDYTNMVSKLF